MSYFDRHFCPFGSDQSSQDLFSYQRQSSQRPSQQMAGTSQWTTHTTATAFRKDSYKSEKANQTQSKVFFFFFFTGQSQRTVKYKKIVLCLAIRLILGTDHSYYCPGWNGKRLRKSQIYTAKRTYNVTENSQASLVSGGLIQSLLDLFIEKNQLFQLITLPICCAQVHILL